MIAITLAICYFFTKRTNLAQYIIPAFKKEWMNQKIEEDAEQVSSRMNFNLTLFLVVAIVVGMQPGWFYLFPMMHVSLYSYFFSPLRNICHKKYIFITE